MTTIKFDKEFFNITDTLTCGQVFRYFKAENGYYIISNERCAFLYEDENFSYVNCEDKDEEYFYGYFDLNRDYKKIYSKAINSNEKILVDSAKAGKGIRLLNQNKTETLISFIVSQNNNIPRIKGIIEKLCSSLGEKKKFLNFEYYAFPKAEEMSKKNEDFYFGLGLGYRAPYVSKVAKDIVNGFNVEKLSELPVSELKKQLLGIYGVGPKVCDCVSLFGYKKTDSFPVDTWIEKVYRENFNGKLTDRNKIAEYFVNRFKENSGYFQQYMFYYKRSIEKK